MFLPAVKDGFVLTLLHPLALSAKIYFAHQHAEKHDQFDSWRYQGTRPKSISIFQGLLPGSQAHLRPPLLLRADHRQAGCAWGSAGASPCLAPEELNRSTEQF